MFIASAPDPNSHTTCFFNFDHNNEYNKFDLNLSTTFSTLPCNLEQNLVFKKIFFIGSALLN